jgi:hypothetical protein
VRRDSAPTSEAAITEELEFSFEDGHRWFRVRAVALIVHNGNVSRTGAGVPEFFEWVDLTDYGRDRVARSSHSPTKAANRSGCSICRLCPATSRMATLACGYCGTSLSWSA